MKEFVYLRYLSLLLVLNSFNFKSSAQLHPSFTGNDDKSSVSEVFCIMQDLTAGRNNSLVVLPGEIWAPVIGYEGLYEISTYSRIKSLERVDCRGQHRKTLVRLQSYDEDGYFICSLSRDRVDKMVRPHRLSAAVWIPNPLNLPEVNHKNGIKTDCHISNLEWTTSKGNRIHAVETGLAKSMKGQNNKGCVLADEQVIEIFNSPLSNRELANKYNIGLLAINRIKIGKTWGWLTGKNYIQKKPSIIAMPSEVVLEIFNTTGSHVEVGKMFNLPWTTIACIKRGDTYSSITGKYNVKKSRK